MDPTTSQTDPEDTGTSLDSSVDDTSNVVDATGASKGAESDPNAVRPPDSLFKRLLKRLNIYMLLFLCIIVAVIALTVFLTVKGKQAEK